MVLHFKKVYLVLISKDTGKSTSNGKKTKVFWSIVIFVLCVGIWLGGMFFVNWFVPKYFPEYKGDSFEALNALISASAFGGVIVSMYLQRKELEMQRESIDMQKEEFESQDKAMKLQRFETTFFNMLSLQQEIVKGLNYKAPNTLIRVITGQGKLNTIAGRAVFEYVFEHICRKRISEKGNSAYQGNVTSLFNHYFLHLYRIVKYVNETNLLETDKERYSYLCILRATLSKYELIHLYYNSIIHSKFKALIEKYSFLDNLDTGALPTSGNNKDDDPYKDSAYDPSINGYNESD